MTDLLSQEQTQDHSLPDGWTTASSEELSEINPRFGKDELPGDLEVTFLPMKCVEELSGKIDVSTSRQVSEVRKSYTPFQEEDFIFAKITLCMENGKMVVARGLKNRVGFGSSEFHVIRPHEPVSWDFLFYFLVRSDFRKEAERNMTGSAGQRRVPTSYTKEATLPLPPLNEQRRIVDEIAELFTKLDAGVRSLKQAQALLKSYRRSVLKAAVEGELSREWREARRDGLEPASELLERNLQERREKFAGKKYKEPVSPDTSELPALPDGWEWVRTAMLPELNSDAICAGPFGTIYKARDFHPSSIPIIFLRHVGEGEYLTHKPGFMDAEKWKELFQSYSVYGGELLVTKLGDPPGVCAIYPDGIGPAMVTPDVIKMSVDNRIANSRFLMHYYNSDVARRFAFGVAFGTTRLRMTLPIFRDITVPLPPLEEQRFIVEEIERRLSVVDKLEATVEENLKQAGSLRQSILKQAFSGRLP